MRWIAWSGWLACLGAAIVVPQGASAQSVGASCADAQPSAQSLRAARERFERAQTALDRGSLEQAATLLREVIAIYDSPNAQLVLGRVLVRQREFVQAHGCFERAISLGAECSQREVLRGGRSRYADAIASAVRERDQVLPSLALVQVRVSGADPSLVRVVLAQDDRVLRGDQSFALSPGRHELSIESQGFITQRVSLDAVAGRLSQPSVTLVRAEVSANQAAPAVRVVVAPRASVPWGFYATAIVAGAVGAGALGTGGYFALDSQAQFRALEGQCIAMGPCPNSAVFSQSVDAGERTQTLGTALVITGSVALATSLTFAVIALTRPRSTRENPASITVSPQLGVAQGLSLRGAF
ncbi:MAG: hypothetical protein Q8Q09_21450 [Deltaproteobacteria bacterium]|nr:hypothetical protein [Deltaproteobacteria bacterium]